MPFSIKRLLIGRPLHTEQAHHEKLPKVLALPVFASDALSSTAYASEEIMAALLVAGAGFFLLTPRLSIGIALLLAIVVISYRQTVMAYPGGGGAYIVAKENLGELINVPYHIDAFVPLAPESQPPAEVAAANGHLESATMSESRA